MAQPTLLEHGLYPDMPAQSYHGCRDNLTQSKLRDILDCPLGAYRKHWSQTPVPDVNTVARTEGSVLHLLALEPDKAPDDILIVPDVKRNTKAGKEAWLAWCKETVPASASAPYATKADFPCEMGGWYLLDEPTHARLENVAGALHADPAYRSLYADREAVELSFAWVFDSFPCRGRADLLTKDGIVVDLKTSANPLGFERAIFNWKLPIQAAFYIDGLRANEVDAQGFIWVVCERSWPHPLIGAFECTPDMIEWGRRWYQHALCVYSDCIEADAWPGLSGLIDGGVLVPNIRQVELPRWATDPSGERWAI